MSRSPLPREPPREGFRRLGEGSLAEDLSRGLIITHKSVAGHRGSYSPPSQAELYSHLTLWGIKVGQFEVGDFQMLRVIIHPKFGSSGVQTRRVSFRYKSLVQNPFSPIG